MPPWRFLELGVNLAVDRNTSDDDNVFHDDWASGGDALPMGPVPLLEFVESGHEVDVAPGMREAFAHELVEAAGRGDVALLQRILASKLARGGADAVSAERSALYAAVEREQMMAAEALMKAGAVVDSSTICYALVAGVDLCKRLLAAVQTYETTARLDGMVQVVAPGEGTGQCRQYTPLGLACASADEHGTTLLLHAGADPNVVADGIRRRTALHIAAGVGSVGCVQALLEAGARTTVATAAGSGLEPVDAPAEPPLRLGTVPPPRLDRAAALRLLQVQSLPQLSPQPLAEPSLGSDQDLEPAPEPDLQRTAHDQRDTARTLSEARADMAAAALLQEVAEEKRRSQQRRDKKRNKKKRAKLRRQMDADAGGESSSSCAGSQADSDTIVDAPIDTIHTGSASNTCAQLIEVTSDETQPSHESSSGSQSTNVQTEGVALSSDLTSLRTSLAAAEACANSKERECLQLGKKPDKSESGVDECDRCDAVSTEERTGVESGSGLPPLTPPRGPAALSSNSSSPASLPTSLDGPCLSPTSTSTLSDGPSSSSDYGVPPVHISPELSKLGEELDIAQAVVRAQYQVMQEAGLRYHIATFGSVTAGGSDRLGINFGKDGATWPVVAEVTPGSLADSIRPPLVGSRLHSIAGTDGRSIHVTGLTLEDGLALVRAIGRPLLLVFERAGQRADTAHHSASVAVGVSEGQRCPSPELLEFEGAVDTQTSYQQAGGSGEMNNGEDEDVDLDDETEEEEYQDAEEHPVPYVVARSDDVDDSIYNVAGEADEQDNTVLGETVREIRGLLNTWLQHVQVTTGSSDGNSNAAAPIAHVYVYGSCLLFGDVVDDDSDIDLLVVAPSIVDRQLHFFGPQPEPIAAETLARDVSAAGSRIEKTAEETRKPPSDSSVLADLLAADPRVCELAPVRDAYVPCLRFNFQGRAIDLTLATPGLKSPLPGEAAQLRGCGWSSDLPAGLMNEAVLQSLSSSGDAATLRSLNAVRVAHAILGSVPNRQTFLGVLRLVKAWAKARGVYGKALGYFGGISWALLTAAACQRLPYNATPEAILQNFFVLWSTWPWPQPVALQGHAYSLGHEQHPGRGHAQDHHLGRHHNHHHSQQALPRPIGPVSSTSSLVEREAWNPVFSPGLMPVVTPLHPSINSSHQLSLSAAAVTQREIWRATRLAPALPALVGPDGMLGQEIWSSPVWAGAGGLSADVEDEFFGSYSSYLRVDVLSASSVGHRRWLGLAEASIARLLRKLERVMDLSLRPLPRCYHTVDGRPNSHWECTAFFIGLQLHDDTAEHQRQKGQLVQICGEFSAAMTRAAGGQGWHTRDMVLSCNCFSATTTTSALRTRVPASPFETAAQAGWQPQ